MYTCMSVAAKTKLSCTFLVHFEALVFHIHRYNVHGEKCFIEVKLFYDDWSFSRPVMK